VVDVVDGAGEFIPHLTVLVDSTLGFEAFEYLLRFRDGEILFLYILFEDRHSCRMRCAGLAMIVFSLPPSVIETR